MTDTITELTLAIQQLPIEYRTCLEPIVNRISEADKRRCRILQCIQDALRQLHLDMKYLVFDLEATRRERDELKRKIGDNDA